MAIARRSSAASIRRDIDRLFIRARQKVAEAEVALDGLLVLIEGDV